jgi:glycosyltransferase involved in cell wall biosynthesis
MPYKPGITVVIPTFDRPAHYLAQAVSSALAQRLQPSEVIVVDNGTRDASLDISSPLLRLIRIKPRAGVSVARNLGAALAETSLVAFLDDDDWWCDAFLENALHTLEEAGADGVYGRLDQFVDGEVKLYKSVTAQDLSLDTLLYRNPGTGGQNLLISRQAFFSVGGYNRQLRASEDRALAIDLILAGFKLCPAPEAIAVIREHEGQRLTRNPTYKFSFLWEYRHLTGPAGILRQILRIVRLQYVRPFFKKY